MTTTPLIRIVMMIRKFGIPSNSCWNAKAGK